MIAFETIKLNKYYGDFYALKDITFSIDAGEFIVLVGPSGCGKSTFMRTIAGLESASDGIMKINGRDATGLLPKERDVAMVFQSYALYPHMTVAENIGFGMKIAKNSKSEIKKKVLAAAKMLKIENYLNHKPKTLSGGQRQRVAIGRAIVRNPSIFLFDEPLSNLDAALRVEMRVEFARLHNSLKTTMIYVTHDQVEAMTLADRIVVMNGGRIEQIGSPLALYNQPRNKFVASFLGQPAVIFVKLDASKQTATGLNVKFAGANVTLQGHIPTGSIPIEIGLRPDFFELTPDQPDLSPQVEVVEHLGDTTLLYIRLPDDQTATVQLPGQINAHTGDQIPLRIACKSPLVFNEAGENLFFVP